MGKPLSVKCNNVGDIERLLKSFQQQFKKADYIKATIDGNEVGRAVVEPEEIITPPPSVWKSITPNRRARIYGRTPIQRESIELQIDDIDIDNYNDTIYISYFINGKVGAQHIDTSLDDFKYFLEKHDDGYKEYYFKDLSGNDEHEYETSHDWEGYWDDLDTQDRERLTTMFILNKLSLKEAGNKENKNKEGWATDVTTRGLDHYYKNGVSLCGKAKVKHFFKNFDKESIGSKYTKNCSVCIKKKKELEK